MLKVFLQLTADLSAKDQALNEALTEAKDKEEHWKRKREEFESQLERNHEHNEELLATTRELQRTLEKEKSESASRQVRLLVVFSSARRELRNLLVLGQNRPDYCVVGRGNTARIRTGNDTGAAAEVTRDLSRKSREFSK